MAVDQIEYCGGCEHYAECQARTGEGPCLYAQEKEAEEEAFLYAQEKEAEEEAFMKELEEDLWAMDEDESYFNQEEDNVN